MPVLALSSCQTSEPNCEQRKGNQILNAGRVKLKEKNLDEYSLYDISYQNPAGLKIAATKGQSLAHLGLRGKWYSVDTIIGDMVGL